jgi:hypothetical protein
MVGFRSGRATAAETQPAQGRGRAVFWIIGRWSGAALGGGLRLVRLGRVSGGRRNGLCVRMGGTLSPSCS